MKYIPTPEQFIAQIKRQGKIEKHLIIEFSCDWPQLLEALQNDDLETVQGSLEKSIKITGNTPRGKIAARVLEGLDDILAEIIAEVLMILMAHARALVIASLTSAIMGGADGE